LQFTEERISEALERLKAALENWRRRGGGLKGLFVG